MLRKATLGVATLLLAFSLLVPSNAPAIEPRVTLIEEFGFFT